MPLVTALLLALVAWWPLSAQRAELERRIRRDTLPNGLEIIVVENHGVPLTTIEAVVRNGSFTQSPTYEGLSHLYEHMFFKANRSYPEPDAFVARASQLGAVFNAQTREELVNYYLTVPSDSTEPAVALLATALRTPLFLREELDRERSVVIGEYDRIESDPFYALNTATGKALWGNAWSRKNPLGERDVILRTTPEQMRTIQRKYYVPNNTALIVTGDVDANKVFAAARRYLGDWPRAADPFKADPIPAVPPLSANKGVVVEEPVSTVIAVIQWDGPGAHADPAATYAADVFDKQAALTSATGDQTLKDAVTKAGLDPAAIDACASTPETKNAVQASVKLAEDLGVQQTPMLAVNGRLVPLTTNIPYETLKTIVSYQAVQDGVSTGGAPLRQPPSLSR